MKITLFVCLSFLIAAFFATNTGNVHAAGASLPPWPLIYTGNVTLGGQPAPDGLIIVGKMKDYVSIPLEIKGGRMVGLTVGPPSAQWFGSEITFELRDGDLTTLAEETDTFTNLISPTLKKDFHLTFPGFPTPSPLPAAAPTVTPLPTATPNATATPIVVGTIVYNGMVVVSGGAIPEGAKLTARIGDYESNPVPVQGSEFISLIIDVNDPLYTNKEISFYLNGISSRTTVVYDVGATIRQVDLIFMDIPGVSTPLPTPSVPTMVPTIVPTIAAPTEIPIPPTVLPTNTAVPTPEPILVPKPQVLNVAPSTPAPEKTAGELAEEEALKETEGSGGCMAVKNIDPLTGTANVLVMIGPILLLVGYRGIRRKF